MSVYEDLPITWSTITRQVLYIKDMDSDHILNCMRMLHRSGGSKGLSALAAVGTFTKHPEAFRREIRRRGDVLVNVNKDRLVII